MADDVNIKIGGDTSGAEASMTDLEQSTKLSFEKMAVEAEEASKDISKSFKSAGIRTEKAINESSRKAKRDFEKIKNSGVASANDIRRAHNAMASKIKRNNRELSVGAGIFSKALKGVKKNLFAITAAAVGLGFALKSAFDFAESGAKLKAQQLAFKNFTTDLGADSDELLKKLTEVSRGTVSQAALIKSAGVALLLGLDPTKITQLMEVARAASKITGEELTTQFEDIAKGTGRASKLILDNLGIMFSQGEATRRAAESAGVLVSELTDVQIKVGNLTEVIRQGQAIIRGVGKDYDSQADALARLKTSYVNIKDAVSIFILKGIFPLERGLLTVRKAWLLMQRDIFSTLPLLAKASDFIGLTSNVSATILDATTTLNKEISELEKTIKNVGKVEKDRVTIAKGATQEITNQKKIEANILKEQKQQVEDNKDAAIKGFKIIKKEQQALNKATRKGIRETEKELNVLERRLRDAVSFVQKIEDIFAASGKAVEQSGLSEPEVIVDDLKRAEQALGLVSDLLKINTKESVKAAEDILLNAAEAVRRFESANTQKGRVALQAGPQGASTSGFAAAAPLANFLKKQTSALATQIQSIATQAIPPVQKKLNTMQASLVAGVNTLAGINTGIQTAIDAAKSLKKILGQDTTSTHTQIINTVNTGGSALKIPGFSDGVKLPGYGGGDKILARLEAGERVISKEATRRLESLGGSAMNALHKGDIEGMVRGLRLPGFREGGKVKSSGSFDVNLKVGDNTFAMSTSKKTGESFMKQIKSMNIIHGKTSKPY